MPQRLGIAGMPPGGVPPRVVQYGVVFSSPQHVVACMACAVPALRRLLHGYFQDAVYADKSACGEVGMYRTRRGPHPQCPDPPSTTTLRYDAAAPSSHRSPQVSTWCATRARLRCGAAWGHPLLEASFSEVRPPWSSFLYVMPRRIRWSAAVALRVLLLLAVLRADFECMGRSCC